MNMLKIGQRVRVKNLNIKGTIFYIDKPNYYVHHLSPIQVELDKPYDEHGQVMVRTNVKDVIKLKKKKAVEDDKKKQKKKAKQQKTKSKENDIFDFTNWI